MPRNDLAQDPLCADLYGPHHPLWASCATCNLIARVRADEREQADCPDPSICDRHNCAAAAAYCDGVADERERRRAAIDGEATP